MIREAIQKVAGKENLTERAMRTVFDEIMTGQATSAQIAAFITALRMKRETALEIVGAARAMRERCSAIRPKARTIVDTCGTGGSGKSKFNISTAVAFVVAGCGVCVAKHGNRSASGRTGSADVLEALGVNIQLSPEAVCSCIDTVGIGFLFAPLFHGAMKYAVAPRKEIGIRTIFNILGPLCNPASATGQVLGVYDGSLTEVMAEALRRLGMRRAFVVHGLDGLDEITVTTRTKISELDRSRIRTYTITPERFGIRRSPLASLAGGDAKENARIVTSILNGEKGPKRDIVLLNAAAALVAGRIAKNLKEGIAAAADSIDSGKAYAKLRALIEYRKQ